MIIYRTKVVNKLNDEQRTFVFCLLMVALFIGFLAGGFIARANYQLKEDLKAKKKNTLVCYCAGDADCLERCGD